MVAAASANGIPSSALNWSGTLSVTGASYRIDNFTAVAGISATSPNDYSDFSSPSARVLSESTECQLERGPGGLNVTATWTFDPIGSDGDLLWIGLFPFSPSGTDPFIAVAGPLVVQDL